MRILIDSFNKFVNEKYESGQNDIFEVKDGCNVVYHGGKIMNNDPKWLIEKQGGIYCTKSLSGAQSWGWIGGIIAKQRWSQISNSISSRVYEFTIKPGSKMKSEHAGGLDSNSEGGLKDERNQYYKDGVIGIAHQSIMDRPNNSVNAESCLDSEIILFEAERSVSFRVIPFIEVLQHYEKFNLRNQYEKMMEWYKQVRKIVWYGYKNNSLVVDEQHVFDKSKIYEDDWRKVAEFYDFSGKSYKRIISEEIDVDKVDSIIEKLSNMFLVHYGHGIQNMTSLDEILSLSGLKNKQSF